MVIVKVSETYDLSTVPDKMGIIGIHTPDSPLISRNYPGLLMQCKNIRYVSCDVTMACASVLPADPLQIGVEAGAIAPQDMFNPILYKAMGNVGMSQMELRLAGLDRQEAPVSVDGCSLIESQANSLPADIDNWSVYYGLLANRHGWRTAMPQSGLQMTDLRPIVHHKVYQFGDNQYKLNGNSENVRMDVPSGLDTESKRALTVPIVNEWMIGKSEPMPSFNTTCIVPAETSTGSGEYVQSLTVSGINHAPAISGYLPNDSYNGQPSMPYIPRIYVACIIMPPCKLNRLYYRITVSWSIEFSSIRPISEIMDWHSLEKFGSTVYFSDYVEANTLNTQTATVDATGMDINKVM